MAYFAVISDNAGSIIIERCHINIWALPGIRTVFFFDVGLGLKSTKKGVKTIQLTLPCITGSQDFLDLAPRLRDADTARLVFGQPVEILKNDIFKFGKTTLNVSPAAGELQKSTPPVDSSHWTITLPKPIRRKGDDTETYIRVRFRVKSFDNTWINQASGAIVDIRISDVRGAQNDSKQETLAPKIVPIKLLNLLAIAPSRLKLRAISPPQKYIRLLEGASWQAYLGRKLSLFGKEKLIVYYWKFPAASTPEPRRNELTGATETPPDTPQPEAQPLIINADNPFMAFLDLYREKAVLGLSNIFMIGLISSVLTYFLTSQTVRERISSIDIDTHWHYLLALGGVAVLEKTIGVGRHVVRAWALLQRLLSWVDKLFFER